MRTGTKGRAAGILLAASSLLIAACSVTTGQGKVTTESRQVSGFSSIELRGSGKLTVEQTGNESLSITAEESVLPDVTSEVTDHRLVLGTKPRTVVLASKGISYHVTVRDLSGVSIAGSGDINASGITTPSLDSRVSGSGAISASGTAQDQHLTISASGSYRSANLESKTASVVISGSGSADIAVSETLDVRISGSGSLTYRGNPQISEHISGSGRLEHK